MIKGAFALVGLTLLGSVSHGFPDYSIKENKKCVYCHFNNQGGPTNARGRYYAKHMSFDGYSSHLAKEKKKRKKKAASKPDAFGGDTGDGGSAPIVPETH